MPKIKIETPAAGEGYAHGTRVWLDGAEVKDVADIKLKFPVDGLVTCELELIATEKFEFEAQADVRPIIVAFPGYRIEQTTNEQTGAKVFHAHRGEPRRLCAHCGRNMTGEMNSWFERGRTFCGKHHAEAYWTWQDMQKPKPAGEVTIKVTADTEQFEKDIERVSAGLDELGETRLRRFMRRLGLR